MGGFFMGKEAERGFSWGDDKIPGRRIALKPGESIAVYNSTDLHIMAKDLITTKPFVIPQTWKDEARAFVESLKKPKREVILLDNSEKNEEPLAELIQAT
jgi:hypothetical protein